MKQGARFLSIFLIITVVGSAIFVGSTTFVLADAPGTYDSLVWPDLVTLIRSKASPEQLGDVNAIENIISDNANNDMFNFVVINYGTSYGIFGFERHTGTTGFYIRSWNNGAVQGGGVQQNYGNQYIRIRFYIAFDSADEYNLHFCYYTSTTELLANKSTKYTINNSNPVTCWPTKFEQQAAGYKVYCFRTISAWDTQNALTQNANIILERPIGNYELKAFYIGTNLYITASDQMLMSRMNPETLGYFWKLIVIDDEIEAHGISIGYNALTYIPNISLYCSGLINIPENDLGKAFLVPDNWTEIFMAKFAYEDEYENTIVVAEAINTPLDLEEKLPSQEQVIENTYINSYNQFTQYLENYNTTHVIPQNLGEELFGIHGLETYGAEVLAPGSLIRDAGYSGYFGEGYFQWHLPLMVDSMLSYDYLDVCVITDQGLLTSLLSRPYNLCWWYDDSLSPSYKDLSKISNQADLWEMFDIVIVVDDPDNILSTALSDRIFTGSNAMGFQYSEAALNSHALKGFAFVTKKAIQKQILYNFNNGITKTYKLMSDYIEKRDSWDDSFLLWSASIYSILDTLDGRMKKIGDKLGSIYNLLYNWDLSTILDDIASKLEEIANNTASDDSELSPWYLSLWNFVRQFEPNDIDFSNALDEIVDIYSELPLLSDPTPAPTIPLLPGGS